MVRDLPKGTAVETFSIIQFMLEILTSYQEWVNELQGVLIQQDEDIKKMRSTIDIQSKTLKAVFKGIN